MRWVNTTLFVVGVLAPVVLAAAPASKPASQPATATATAPADPKASLMTFMQAMFGGDEKATFDLLYFANDDAKKEAQAVIGAELMQRQWQTVLDAAFNPAPGGQGNDLSMVGEIGKQIAESAQTIHGDTAELSLGGRASSIAMVREKGVWKIDFDKTQRGNEGPANPERIAAGLARFQVYKDVIGLVKDKKLATRAEAQDELQKRLAVIPTPQLNAQPANVAPANPGPGKPVAVNGGGRKGTLADMDNLKTALRVFEVDNGRYPTTAEGMNALVVAPNDVKKSWNGPYLEKVPVDGWGHPYTYLCPGTADPASFDLVSNGPDGIPGTADDISSNTAN